MNVTHLIEIGEVRYQGSYEPGKRNRGWMGSKKEGGLKVETELNWRNEFVIQIESEITLVIEMH